MTDLAPAHPLIQPGTEPPSISYSRASSYVRCPAAYNFRYNVGLKIAPSWSIIGRASHEAEAVNFEQKITSGRDLPVQDVRDTAATAFDRELQTEEVIWEDGDNPGRAKDRAVLGAETHHILVAPPIQPILVEEPFKVALPWGTILTGRMDVVDQAWTIHDAKHVADAPKDGAEEYEAQPGLYGFAARAMVQERPRFILDYVVLGRKNAKAPKPRALSREVQVTDAKIGAALERLQQVERAIRAGIVYGVSEPFKCSGCGFRRVCKWSAAPK